MVFSCGTSSDRVDSEVSVVVITRKVLLFLPVLAYGAALTVLALRNMAYEMVFEGANPSESIIIHSGPSWEATFQGAAGTAFPVLVVVGTLCAVVFFAQPLSGLLATMLGQVRRQTARIAGATGIQRLDKRYRVLIVVLAALVIGGASYGVATYRSFEPQHQRSYDVGSVPVEEHFELAKGQMVKVRFSMGVTDRDEKVTVVVRNATSIGDGVWLSGYIAKDSPNVGDGDKSLK